MKNEANTSSGYRPEDRSRCLDRAFSDFLPSENRESNKKPITTPLFLSRVSVPELDSII